LVTRDLVAIGGNCIDLRVRRAPRANQRAPQFVGISLNADAITCFDPCQRRAEGHEE
jgi:hypothetical protein